MGVVMQTWHMLYLRCQAVRWVDDEPFPGLVEVRFVDADGREWSFVDKAAVFEDADRLSRSANYPVPVEIRCETVGGDVDPVIVSVAPWGLESVEGRAEFKVRADQLAVR